MSEITDIEVTHEEINLKESEVLEELKQIFVGQAFHYLTCGHACLEMVTGAPIETITEILQNDKNLNIKGEVNWFLKHKGYRTKLVEDSEVTFDSIPNNSIIRLEYPNGIGHYIVKKHNRYLDPAEGIVQMYIGIKKITHYISFEKQNSHINET